MKVEEDLVGKCGIYCGACRLHVMKNCEGCSVEEDKCPFIKCINADADSCGECEKFPCEKHTGPMAVYSKRYINWKKQEIARA